MLLVERLARRRERLAELNAQLALLVNVDMLTGLPNRRSVDHELDQSLAVAKRYEHPLSVLMIDIDAFKEINDRFGHAAGDAALRHVAAHIRSTLRDVDVPGRWAGDEFLVVLPHVDAEGAQVVAGRLNEAVANAPLSIDGESTEITLSIGVAQWQGEPAKDLIHRADEALYVAKAEGRDRFFTSAAFSDPALVLSPDGLGAAVAAYQPAATRASRMKTCAHWTTSLTSMCSSGRCATAKSPGP